MKFSIITPTYKRADKLVRCVNSVFGQTYQNFEMIIINDSPDDSPYNDFEKNITDSRIKYFKTEKNMGVNYTRNFVLDNLSSDSNYVIFLDDDDWFANDTLSNFEKLIKENPNENWLVTNRAYEDGKPLTFAPKNNTHYDYAFDYLICRKFIGDVTHCIKTNEINAAKAFSDSSDRKHERLLSCFSRSTSQKKNIRFSKKIKQGEEWFFFYQLGLKNKFFYTSHNSTFSEGYDMEQGLNFRKQSKVAKIKNTSRLFIEGVRIGIAYHPSFLLYIKVKILITIFK